MERKTGRRLGAKRKIVEKIQRKPGRRFGAKRKIVEKIEDLRMVQGVSFYYYIVRMENRTNIIIFDPFCSVHRPELFRHTPVLEFVMSHFEF
jgi:hypothetical protein